MTEQTLTEAEMKVVDQHRKRQAKVADQRATKFIDKINAAWVKRGRPEWPWRLGTSKIVTFTETGAHTGVLQVWQDEDLLGEVEVQRG